MITASVTKGGEYEDIRPMAFQDLVWLGAEKDRELETERRAFWGAILQPDSLPNPNIYKAIVNGGFFLGYLAVGVESEVGLVQPGLNIVVNPRFEDRYDVTSKLLGLAGIKLQAEVQPTMSLTGQTLQLA